MKKITIPFSGITRNTDDTISSDGECMELINARVKNGSISPVGKPILEKSFLSNRSPIYIHKNGIYEHLITYENNCNLIYEANCSKEDSYVSVNTPICSISDITSIESIGNTLIILTSTSIHYALFSNTEYLYLGEKPDFPEINFQYFLSSSPKSSEEISYNTDPPIPLPAGQDKVTLDANNTTSINTSFRATINKLLNSLNNEGLFVSPFVVRYALRLFNGSYIMHSPPILLFPQGYSSSILITEQNTLTGHLTGFKYKISAQPSTLGVQYDLTTLDKWKDIVSSVDIFISRPINRVDLDSDITLLYKVGNNISFSFNYFENSEMIEKIVNTSNFFKVKTITSGSNSKGLYEDFLKDTNNLEQKEAMTDDQYTHNAITGKSFVFNNRLHVANIRTQIAPMFPISIYHTSTAYSKFITLHTEVHIKAETGTKIVHGECQISIDAISPYISYPDYRAYKLILYFSYAGINYYKELNLKPHSILNLAYNLETTQEYLIDSGHFTVGTYNPKNEESIELYPNKIKVSEISNPFFFPAKQTYTISGGNIIGMASATAALSTGQFGQFPLYVFSSDGIYTLSIGSDSIVYSSSHPVSRDVCTNAKSIVSIDNAIVFSTESGIMLLSGSSVQKLSDKIEGYLPSSFVSSPVLNEIIKIPKLKSSMSDFRDYINDSVIGYIYEDKEIIISNEKFPYSYVYNLQSNEWYKISESIKHFLNSYPLSLAVISKKPGYAIYNMHNPHRTINDIAIITRPVKLGSITHKRILQSALRGIIKPSLSDLYFKGEPVQFRGEDISIFSNAGFYILGSNDAEHFKLIAGTEKLNDIRDLITKMNKTKAYKYFIFCLVGGVRTDVAINYIEVMADETFDNRLR